MTTIKKFDGINNVTAPERLKDTELTAAQNIDIDNSKRVSSRIGYSSIYAGNNVHSLWSNQNITLFIEDGSLSKLNADYSATELRSGLARFSDTCYANINDDVYYSDGNVTGVIDSAGSLLPMGIPTPSTTPALTLATGVLPAGRYGVLFTAADFSGMESGASYATFIDLDAAGAITVTGIPTAVDGAASVNVYMTRQNGSVWYLSKSVQLGTASVLLDSLPEGQTVRTQHLHQMPAGHLMAYHRGRLYVAVGNTVYYSEPYMYGLTKIGKNFLMFPEKVTMIAPVEDGIYFSSDKVYHVYGTDPDEFSMKVKSDAPAIAGTAVRVLPEMYKEGHTGDVWMWISSTGVWAGLEGGSVENLTAGRYVPKVGDVGAAEFIQVDGKNQFVSAIHTDDSERSNIYASDVAVAEIRRNGVIIT